MNETLQNTIAELLNKYGIAFDETKQWTTETLMPYIEELVKRMRIYNIVEQGMLFVVFVTLFILSILFFKFLIKKYKENQEHDEVSLFFDYDNDITPIGLLGVATSSVVLICSFIIGLFILSDLLKWIFIPDIQFIEYISNLISNQ